jgi:hypothetical protein
MPQILRREMVVDRWTWQFLAWTGLVLLFLDWVLFGVTCWVGSKKSSRRNAWAGIRIPSVMSSDAAWVAGHAAAMPHVRQSGIALLPVGIVMICFAGTHPIASAIAECLLFLVGLVWMFVATAAASRAAKQVAKIGEIS